jgi:hypothetical protein
MKYIKIALITLLILIVAFVLLSLSRFTFFEGVTNGYEQMIVNKPTNMSSDELVDLMVNDPSTEVIYRGVKTDPDGTIYTTYYMTDTSDASGYINDYDSSVGCYSEVDGSLKLLSNDREVYSVCSMDELSSAGYDLTSSRFYVLGDRQVLEETLVANGVVVERSLFDESLEMHDYLQQEGVILKPSTSETGSNVSVTKVLKLIPIAVYFIKVLILFNVFQIIKGFKKYGVYRLNGLSTVDVMIEEFVNGSLKWLISIVLSLVVLFFYLLIRHGFDMLYVFDVYSVLLVIGVYFITEFVLMVIAIVFYRFVKVDRVLKNSANFNVISVLIAILKVLFSLMMVMLLSLSIAKYSDLREENLMIDKYAGIDNYYTINSNVENQLDRSVYDQLYKDFYLEYNDELNGMLIYTQDYYANCYEHSEYCYIVVNENYLEENPVYLEDGSVFDPSTLDYSQGHGYMLVPRNREADVGLYTSPIYLYGDYPTRLYEPIYIQSDQEFFSYDSTKGDMQWVKNPVIYLVDDEVVPSFYGRAMGNYNAQYFVESEDVEVIYDAIDESGLNQLVQEVYLKQSINSESIASHAQDVSKLMVYTFINVILYVIIIWYSMVINLNKDRKLNAIKYTQGYYYYQIYRRYFYIPFVFYGVVLLLSFVLFFLGFVINRILFTILLMFLFELLFTLVLIVTSKPQTLRILKGEE